MINTLANGLLALLMAKFVLNDLPHSAGLLANPVPAEKIAKGVRSEVEWGKKQYGEKIWASERWAKVTNGRVTLYHGTNLHDLPSILREGLKPSTVGWGYDEEDIDLEEAPTPAVWLAYTPYLAFFFGDVAIQVSIPVEWIAEANDGVLVEKHIPPEMIDEYMLIENWS